MKQKLLTQVRIDCCTTAENKEINIITIIIYIHLFPSSELLFFLQLISGQLENSYMTSLISTNIPV